MTMKCELCAYSVEACRKAARLGIDRVELCASPAEGGTTPSLAAIEQASAIKGIDVSVMIRPRGGDFLYTDIYEEGMVERVIKCAEDTQNYYNEQDKEK